MADNQSPPPMSYNTTDGSPPISLAAGGTNVFMPQQQSSIIPTSQTSGMQTITIPTAILQHQDVINAVQKAAQDISMKADMAQKASQMPDVSMGDDRTQAMIKNMQAMKNSGVMAPLGSMQNHPVLGGIANAAMAFGQGITHQPFLSDFNAQQQARNQQMGEMARYGQLTPDQQINIGLKQATMANTQEQRQNSLETQAQNRLSSIRGDTSLAKIETQRDAASSAYNTLQTAEHEGRLPNQFEYNDLLGQLWKARTGTAPTDDVMQSFNVGTIEQNMNKMYSYFSGKTAPANTKDVINSLKAFVASSGNSLDQQHAGYYSTHLVKPTGLNQDRWDALSKEQRGLSFKDATKQYADSLNNPQQSAPTGSPQQQATQASAMPFSVGQQYNGHKILGVQKVG